MNPERSTLCLKRSLICGLAIFLWVSYASGEQLVVRTNYHALVLYYNPHVLKDGKRLRVREAYDYRDIDQLCRDYSAFLRKASGGQVNFSVAFRYELDEFPPDTDPQVTFTAENYDRYRTEGYDMFNHGKADYAAICRDPRFNIIPRVEAREVDVVWIFGPDMTGFWETAMAGREAYWVNGEPYPDVPCSRKFVLFGFGMAAHQGVGFMLENTAHMIENIMHHRIASGWPKRHLVTGWNTLDLTNPQRNTASYHLNDWDLFTSTDSVHWDTQLVIPGGSHAGLSHFPPTACVNYGWSAPRFNFDVPWEAEAFRTNNAEWLIHDGLYSVTAGPGRSLCYGSHDLRDNRGEYRVPVILTDADIETAIRIGPDSTSGHAGLLFRYGRTSNTNELHGYYLGLNPALNRIELARISDSYDLIASHPIKLESGTHYPLFLSLRGSQVRVALSNGAPSVLSFDRLHRSDGAVGLASYCSHASFSHLSITPVIRNYAENWRSYPILKDQPRIISPLDWAGDNKPYGDMDYWYAWWYEHLPKNPGTHPLRYTPSGGPAEVALNSWWPYFFDINVFDQPGLSTNVVVISAIPDTTPPAQVADLKGKALSSTTVRLEWTEPHDNVGTTRYEVFRDGQLLRRTPLTYFEDQSVAPESTHAYYVQALDGSANVSPPSQTATVTTRSLGSP